MSDFRIDLAEAALVLMGVASSDAARLQAIQSWLIILSSLDTTRSADPIRSGTSHRLLFAAEVANCLAGLAANSNKPGLKTDAKVALAQLQEQLRREDRFLVQLHGQRATEH